MSSKNERLDITMRLLGARQMEAEGKKGAKGVESVGKAATRTGHATSKTARATSLLTKSYGRLGKAARYGIGFLGVGGVFALESAVTNTQELSKVTTGLNRNLDLSIQEGSRWAAMAHARGIATTALNMSFTKMAKNFVEANRKGGTARTALNQLGITYNQTARGAHDFNYALKLVGRKFGEAHSGPQRQAAGMALLGKGYQTILPLFAQGNKALKEQLGWANKYGVTLDGKTNKSLMDMVTAERESKVAMLGLQVSLTKALMPAIDAGEGQLQEFIATLNDPKLSSDQKIARISHQFLKLESDLFKLLDKALPKMAEQGGQLGLKLAGALWHGFIHSDTLGKLVIGGWVFKSMGGLSAIGMLGGKIGGKLAKALGWKFLTTVAPYFAAEAGVEGLGSALGSQMGGLKTLFGGKGKVLGKAMGVFAAGALVAEIVFAVENSEDIAGLSLFNTPQTGSTSIEDEAKRLTDLGYTGVGFNSGHELEATTPGGKRITEVEKGGDWITKRGNKVITASGPRNPASHQRGAAHRDASHTPRRRETAYLRPIVIHHKTILDGKQIAESVTKHALRAAALA